MKKKRSSSLLRWFIWAIAIQLILINISAAFYAYKLTHFYQDKTVRDPFKTENIFGKTWRLFTGPRFQKSMITELPNFKYDEIKLKTHNGTILDGWYTEADSTSRGTVILFHGVTSSKDKLLSEAYEFRYWGYNVLMMDFRGHGNSSGNTTTVGIRESEDVKIAYDFVKSKGEDSVFLYGISMGAVAVIKAISDYDLKPAGAILEMPFLSMQTQLRARARLLGFRGFSEKPFGFLVAGWISIERGTNAYKFKTPRYAAKINCPVLMQWGASDPLIYRDDTEKIFNSIGASNKKLVIYDHAGHESLLQNEPAKWRNQVGYFLGIEEH
ncbi:MAG TPA: alpha/beta hydrolase [Chitinophagaceae bacterium]|nr:alpha/beta hydrolase [Chitinophagaceae bacterium]